jgi:hypothetical protein
MASFCRSGGWGRVAILLSASTSHAEFGVAQPAARLSVRDKQHSDIPVLSIAMRQDLLSLHAAVAIPKCVEEMRTGHGLPRSIPSRAGPPAPASSARSPRPLASSLPTSNTNLTIFPCARGSMHLTNRTTIGTCFALLSTVLLPSRRCSSIYHRNQFDYKHSR